MAVQDATDTTDVEDLRRRLASVGRSSQRLWGHSRAMLRSAVTDAAAAGMSQREIARAVGRSQPEISRLLRKPVVSSNRPSTALAARRDELKRLARSYGFTHLTVFGSVARGDDVDGSDVDLLIAGPRGTNLSDLSAFQHDAEALLGVDVDVVDWSGLNPNVDGDIVDEARSL